MFAYNLPNFQLPPPGSRWNSFRPHVGAEVAFEDLVPGEHYFRKFVSGPYGDIYDNYEEIIFESKEGNTYRYYPVRQMQYLVNEKGDPELPFEVPEAPRPPGMPHPANILESEIYSPGMWKFYKVAAVRRGRHLVGEQIKTKHNTNTRRRYINNFLQKKGFSTNVGTGPANLIRQFANLQPPKGAVTTYTVPSGMIKYKGKKTRRANKRRI